MNEKTKTEQDKQAELFPMIGSPDNPIESKKDGDGLSDADKIRADLEKERDDLRKKLEEMSDANRQTNEKILQMMSRQQDSHALSQPVNKETEKAPDPLEDPEGFRKYVADGARSEAQKILDEANARNSARQKYDGVWGQFKSMHPDLMEKHEKLVTTVIRQKLTEAKDRGIHPDVLLLENSGQFINDVANETRSMLGLGQANRTVTTEHVTSSPERPGKQQSTKAMSFIDELKEQQLKSGFF